MLISFDLISLSFIQALMLPVLGEAEDVTTMASWACVFGLSAMAPLLRVTETQTKEQALYTLLSSILLLSMQLYYGRQARTELQRRLLVFFIPSAITNFSYGLLSLYYGN